MATVVTIPTKTNGAQRCPECKTFMGPSGCSRCAEIEGYVYEIAAQKRAIEALERVNNKWEDICEGWKRTCIDQEKALTISFRTAIACFVFAAVEAIYIALRLAWK